MEGEKKIGEMVAYMFTDADPKTMLLVRIKVDPNEVNYLIKHDPDMLLRFLGQQRADEKRKNTRED